MDAVMDACHLAKFKRVQNQTGVTIGGKPGCAVLIVPFRTKGVGRMAAEVEYGGQRPARSCGNIKVARYIKARQTLEHELFYPVISPLKRSGNLRVERRAFRQRIES